MNILPNINLFPSGNGDYDYHIWSHRSKDGWYFLHVFNMVFAFESYWFNKNCRSLSSYITVRDDFEGVLVMHVAIPFIFSWFFHIDARPPKLIKWFCGKDSLGGGRRFGFQLDRELSSFYFWCDDMGYAKHRGWDYSIFNDRLLKGKDSHDVVVDATEGNRLHTTMPKQEGWDEHTFVLDIKVVYRTIKYTRWPNRIYKTWKVEAIDPPKFPGKGTTSYNCGDDYISEMSFLCDEDCPDWQSAAECYKQAVRDNRAKYPL